MIYYNSMTTSELISYIRRQIENNIPKDLIISKLLGAGWHQEDIDEGFSDIESEFKQEIPIIEKKEPIKEASITSPITNIQSLADKYHEPIEGDNLFEIEKVQHKEEASKVEAPVQRLPVVEIKKFEAPVVETPKIEEPKVWTPMSVPIKEKIPEEKTEPYIEAKTKEVEVQNVELPAKPKGIEYFNKTSPFNKPKNKTEELLPTLVLKSIVNSSGPANKVDIAKPINAPTPIPTQAPQNTINNLAKMAMLSSYAKDMQSVSKAREENSKQKNHKIIKWLIPVLIIITVAIGVWVLFASGYVNLKNINIPFIKKDPKTLLLNNSKVLASLKSYKTETKVEISSPSFSNITSGLLSGEAITSTDKDTFSVDTLGIINQNEKGLSSDNYFTIKSTLLSDGINADIKNDGTNLYVSVPDLTKILDGSAPKSEVVKINEQQFGLIPPLFSEGIEAVLNKINVYKILSSGMPSYVNADTLNAYNVLINKVGIIDKGQENIRGVDTYHYSISVDRELAKNLLNKISDNIVLNLSTDDKDRLTQILGSTTVDSFDVWVGKGDNNIYQYNVVLNIPLSKILGFDDKSIGDNLVSVNWKTTYYDFDISNNIIMPDSSVLATDFVNDIKETKIKNEVTSFKQLADNLQKTEKTFGKTSNKDGSCTNPVSGSLFSPTGHGKSSADAVGSISLLMNNILETTNNAGNCYSTPKAWSFTIPIAPSYDSASVPTGGFTSFFCIDSTGTTKDLTASPSGVVCQ
jgi:hypothetical protein